MADRTPPHNRHTDPWRVQIDLEIRNSVKQVRRAFDRSRIDTVFDTKSLEGSAFHDRLPDDRMGPGNRIARRIETGLHAVVPHRAIPAAAYIVFARPDNFHGRLQGFRDSHRFHDKVRSRIRAAAKATTKERRDRKSVV